MLAAMSLCQVAHSICVSCTICCEKKNESPDWFGENIRSFCLAYLNLIDMIQGQVSVLLIVLHLGSLSLSVSLFFSLSLV